MVALGPAGPGRLVDVVTTAAKAGKGTPDILEIEAAEAMAQRFSILESVDIPAGAIGTSPLRPEGHPAHQASTDVASLPLESSDDASPAILNYVKRRRASLVIDNAVLEPSLVSDPTLTGGSSAGVSLGERSREVSCGGDMLSLVDGTSLARAELWCRARQR